MANRFPLIVNPISKKIEELSSGDNINLSSSGIYTGSSTGSVGEYLKSTGTSVEWDNPGDVYLNLAQTLTNKTFINCVFSGAVNNLSSIANSSLLNSSITLNGQEIALGGSFTFPTDTNTTYNVSLTDGADATRKILRLTGTNPSSTDDVTFKAGQNITISRINDEITFNSSYVDTITRVQGEAGGTPTSGDIVIAGTGSTSVSQFGQTITINSTYVDTITRLKGESAGTFQSGDFTLLQGGATTITQASNNITISSQNTITRLKGGSSGVLTSGDVTIVGTNATTVTQSTNTITVDSANTVTRVSGGNSGTPVTGDVRILTGGASSVAQSGNDITVSSVNTITRVRGGLVEPLSSGDFTIVGAGASTVSQSGNTITVTSVDTNTVTRLQGTPASGGILTSGDITITGAGAATVTQSGSTITVTSTDTDTNYSAGIGLALSGTTFSLKNQDSLTNNKLLKWNSSNGQLVNSNIADDGSTVTITGNLNITGTTTTVNTATLVVNDNEIELRSGTNIIPANGGIQINRTTDGTGSVTAYQSLQWFESGGFWRSFNGSTSNRFVTENEIQTLTNKTLTSPILTAPQLGIATVTTINKVSISQPATGASLTINEGKSLNVSNSVTFSGTDNSTVNFGSGGSIAYITNKLSAFAATSSDEFRGIISDETGIGKLVFATSPEFTTSITTASATFSLFNTTASQINAFGSATLITIGAISGDTTIRNNLLVNGNVTLSNDVADTVTVNGSTTFNNEDVIIRGIRVGRGASGVDTNTSFGKESLRLVVGTGAGNQNTALGYETLYSNNTGNRNVAVGFRAGRTITSGNDNVTVGNDALYTNTVGTKNIAVGAEALFNNVQGEYNVVIGYKAGWSVTGSGNVVIGPAQNGNSSDATYQLLNPTGSNQLVIGSGANTWIRGDNNFDITVPNNLGVAGNLTINGTTNLNSRILTVKASNVTFVDKELTLGNVTTTTFSAIVQQGQTSITLTSFGTGIIPGMVVVSQTDGITVPTSTTIVSIDEVNSTAVLSAAPNLGTGSVIFQATGPSNTSADGGGIRVKGTTDKTFIWSNTSTGWLSNQALDLNAGLSYKINNVSVLNSTTLGTNVINSSLTSVGTLSSLSIANNGTAVGLTITNTGTGDCLVVNDEASDTTPFIINNAGFVGIGNSSPLTNLHIGTGSGNNLGVLLSRGVTTNFFEAHDGTKTFIGGTDNTNAFIKVGSLSNHPVAIIQSNGAAIYIDTSKRVGFGTAIPKSVVDISLTGTANIATTTITKVTDFGTSASFGFNGLADNNDGVYFGMGAGGGNGIPAGIGFMRESSGWNTALSFYTNNVTSGPNSTNAIQEKARLDSNGNFTLKEGNLVIGTSGKGIDFSANANAAGMTSELLDDYERGTWTPSLINAGTPSYSSASGEYVKIGSSVWLNFTMSWSGATASSNTRIGGLPFAMTDSDTKVRGWATSDTSGTTVYSLSTTGLSNTALYYHPSVSNASVTVRGSIQITTL